MTLFVLRKCLPARRRRSTAYSTTMRRGGGLHLAVRVRRRGWTGSHARTPNPRRKPWLPTADVRRRGTSPRRRPQFLPRSSPSVASCLTRTCGPTFWLDGTIYNEGEIAASELITSASPRSSHSLSEFDAQNFREILIFDIKFARFEGYI